MNEARVNVNANPNTSALFTWHLAAAAATVHIELADVFRSPFWPGSVLSDWLATGAVIGILATVGFSATQLTRLVLHRAHSKRGTVLLLDTLVPLLTSGVLAAAYLAHGGEAVMRISATASCSIGFLWVLWFIVSPRMHPAGNAGASFALATALVAIAGTYGSAEWLFELPRTRASVILWLGPALIPLTVCMLLATRALVSWRPGERMARVAAAILALAFIASDASNSSHVADDGGRPNLVLVTFDALRADYASAYGGTVSTPALERIANRGLLFEHAYSLAPWTVPSMHSMFASRYPAALPPQGDFDEWRTAVSNYRFVSDGPTLAQKLKADGYATAAYVGNPLLGGRDGILRGFDTGRAWPAHAPLPTGPLAHSPGARGILEQWFGYKPEMRPIDSGAIIAKCARRFIAKHESRPFFLWVHLIDPHDPYDPPEEFRSIAGAWPLFSPSSPYWGTPQLDAYGQIAVDPKDREFVRSLYEGDIAYADRRLAEIINRFFESGVDSNTYICVTADHGEELWDHGRYGHGRSLYDELVHVPLLFCGGNITNGRVSRPVSAVDLMPTLASLMNVEANSSWKGRTIAPVLFGQTALEERLCFAQATNRYAWPNSYRMARIGPLKLIENMHDGSVQLFDVPRDPREKNNLAEKDAALAEPLVQTFQKWLTENGEVESPDLQDADAEMIELLKSMGYIE